MAPRSGYTLPVFACAAALAALKHLQRSGGDPPITQVSLPLIDPPETATIAIEQVAQLQPQVALAITRSDPGDNLDLTRHTPIWAQVELNPLGQTATIVIQGGEGIGHHQSSGAAAIYRYARHLLQQTLAEQLAAGDRLRVTLILPEGQALAQRTSNAAFGVVEGLSLLGTSGLSQPLSSPEQLTQFQQDLEQKAQQYRSLVFCVGENGLDLAKTLGIPPEQTLKTANWLGPLLVAAALNGVQEILLFGYHGKLIKLAGGIFHTHHHVADGRLEILTAHAGALGLPPGMLPQLLNSGTVEAALALVRSRSQGDPIDWATQLYDSLAQRIDDQAQGYMAKHVTTSGDRRLPVVGCLLFDRQRQIIVTSPQGQKILQPWLPS
ncbi:cobalt-precorrin-5B (C(1))-methyltransferase CbiD [Prochlorothrix hollandica]|uniref:Cobalt-precorrin-5B C(1)-methyltransferase n=1 Tax=Prochlorothrix hollandica PCC 9006 = CALU 1027 TaxID=317619 RepID=A0A0M2PZT8_PROHO|nr:cobalt-precorrin-5B (C(1))-methyltransferase CbiD [Prochlorothrix hollandica]KKJ01680.1 cobalt-precorrin-6A synthase [Prochlorothrix hollandica PCC 9006 = CALU 1027]